MQYVYNTKEKEYKIFNKNITPKQPFNNKQIKHIKGALIMNLKDLKKTRKLRLEKKMANHYSSKRLL